MTIAQLRQLALALPGAEEQPHFHRASFRVGKKIFCTLDEDEGEAMVRVQPRAKLHALLKDHPRAFKTLGNWTALHGALGVVVKQVERTLFEELLIASYRRVAPKKLLAILDGDAS